jgi:hypothetical protein
MLHRLTRILVHLRPFHYPLRQFTTMTTLGDRRISTAGCLIIGDEVLSSKTMDTNSAHFGSFLLMAFTNVQRDIVLSWELT